MTKMKQVKYTATLLIIVAGLFFSKKHEAQSFYGYQTIGKHTFLFSIIWQGEPKIGFSYIDRIYAGKTFNDLQLELRFPLKDIYRFNSYEAIAGIYKPTRLRRTFAGIGGHLRWESNKNGGSRIQKLSLAATVIPSYVFAASLTDGVYGTIGLRITYAPVIFATQSGEWNFFGQHKFEGGIHFDMHTQRTLGLALNPVTTYFVNGKNTFLEKPEPWKIEGDFYFGATYKLNRNK